MERGGRTKKRICNLLKKLIKQQGSKITWSLCSDKCD